MLKTQGFRGKNKKIPSSEDHKIIM